MSLTGFDLPPPRNWQAFEALCHDLFSREWAVTDCNRIGRNGQRQSGVDIVAKSAAGWVGAQCKWIGRTAGITSTELQAIADEARAFRPVLTHLTVATTAANDAPLQELARKISDEHAADGTFTLSLVCWDDLVARLDAQPEVVARHYAALMRFLSGHDPVTTQYATRISNFVSQYLGDSPSDAPFIGREDDLAALDRWLADEHAPYALMRAPAGLGKSALLVNWTASLGDAVALIFMPISVRFRTNLAQVVFESLLIRLAPLHGLAVSDLGGMDVERARGLVSDLLARPLPDGLRLVVVIDGLDEAADFEIGHDLFPARPPPGLKILCAGRPVTLRSDPLHTIAQRHFTLSALPGAIVATALQLTEISQADTTQIARLAQGDPLLVRLYIEGLQAGEVEPSRLTAATPGLHGYFEAWWSDQQSLWQSIDENQAALIESILRLLACAIGPLSRDDLLDPSLVGLNSNVLALDKALDALSRWVVGRGRTNDLVLSHPRFADYLREEWMGASQVSMVESQILAWGSTRLAALEVDPNQHLSPYLIANLGAHFERAGFPQDRFQPMTRRTWAQQCHVINPSLRGFLADVERRAEATRRSIEAHGVDTTLLLAFVDCALAIATVRTIAKGLPANVYVAALRLGIWSADTVLEHMLTVDSDGLSAEALIELAKGLGPARSAEVLTLALSVQRNGKDAEILRRIYPVLAEAEQVHIASDLVRRAEISEHRTAYGPPLPNDVSLSIARAVQQVSGRVPALSRLLPWLPAAEAENIEHEIEGLILGHPEDFKEDIYYNGALQNLTLQRRQQLVAHILSGLDEDQQRRVALTEIGYDPAPELIDIFLNCAADIEDAWERADALKVIAKSVPRDRISEYLAQAYRLEQKTLRAAALAALGRYHYGDWATTALNLCRTEEMHPSVRAPILVDACHWAPDKMRLEIEPLLLSDLDTPVDTRAWDEHDPEWLLVDFAFTFTATSPQHTFRLLREVSEGEVRARAAANLVVDGPPSVREQATELLADIEEPFGMLDAYSHIVAHSSGEQRARACRNAATFARTHGNRAELIDIAIARHWDIEQDLGADLVHEALELGVVHDWREVGDLLVALAPFLTAEGKRKARGMIRLIDSGYQREVVARAYNDKTSNDDPISTNTRVLRRRVAWGSPEPALSYSRSGLLDAVRNAQHGRVSHNVWFELLLVQDSAEIAAATLALIQWAATTNRAVVIEVLTGLAPSIDRAFGKPASDGILSLLQENALAWGEQPRRDKD